MRYCWCCRRYLIGIVVYTDNTVYAVSEAQPSDFALREAHRRTEGIPLCRFIVVVQRITTDEFDSRAVEPDLLFEFVSMVLCTPNVRLVGLTVDAFQPLVHLEHFA